MTKQVISFLVLCLLVYRINCHNEDGDNVNSVINELDKAAETIQGIKGVCRGEYAWLSLSGVSLNVSCHSMYQLCKIAMDAHYDNILQDTSPPNLVEVMDDNNNSTEKVTTAEAYGYGFIMVTIVSLLSLLGLFIVPLLSNSHRFGRVAYRYVLTLLTAMGVSALLCGALFELLPTIFRAHDHDDHDINSQSSGHGHSHAHIWKASAVVGGVFLFYLFELILQSCTCITKNIKPSVIEMKENTDDEEPLISNNDSVQAHPRPCNCEKPNCKKIFSLKHVRPLAWMILVGDLVHNMADGITVGAAVSQSLSLGLSTTFAICLHEIPHELANFGILIKSGLHWVAALFFNFLSSLTAVIGFFIGVAISTNSDVLKDWLLAIAAGSFLYISLADLLPELHSSSDHSHNHAHTSEETDEQTTSWHHKIIHSFIVLLGFSIAFVTLLLVSLNEDKLDSLF